MAIRALSIVNRSGNWHARWAVAWLAALVGAIVVTFGPASAGLGPSLADRTILGLAAISMAAVLAAAILRPWAGLCLWLLTMPILNVARVRLETQPVELTATSLALLAITLGAILADRPLSRPDHQGPAIPAAAVALVGIAALSTALHPDSTASWPVVVHGVAEPVVAALLVIALRPEASGLLQLVASLVASAGISAAYSLFRVGRTTLAAGPAAVTRADFGHYIYYNVNIFGEILVMVIPLGLGLFLLQRSRSRRLITLGVVLILIAAVYLTYSKGAWLGALAGSSAVITLASRRPWQRAVSLLATALIGLVIVPVPLYLASWLGAGGSTVTPGASATSTPAPDSPGGVYAQVVQQLEGADRASSWDPTSSSGEVSVRERFFAWQAAARMAESSPLVGVGPGRFGPEYETQFSIAGAQRALNSAHNYLLNIAAETGLIAVALVTIALSAAIWRSLRSWRRGTEQRGLLGLAVGAALIGFLVVGETTGADLYEVYRVMNSDAIFLAVLVGAGLWLRQLERVATQGPMSAA